MSNANIADTKPAVLKVEPGTYYYCSCGLSSNQPFCNGAHKGSTFTPIKVEIEEAKTVAFCNCKQSQNGAFCDGSHTKL